MIPFKDIIAEHGGDPACFFNFDDEGDQVHLLPYATLSAARSTGKTDPISALMGVYEWQSGPLFMLVDGDAVTGDPEGLARLRRLVAMRGDAPYIAVLQMGRLSFHSVGLDNESFDATRAISEELDDLGMVIPFIANTRPNASSRQVWISDVILNLLTAALDALVALKIDDGDAISLVGRALFTRFLADRGLLPGTVSQACDGGINHLFDSAASAAKVSVWLDETFNGDFLPLSDASIHSIPEAAFQTVGNIMRRAPDGQLPIEWAEDWARLDFAHIPVGVLSQAYERYLGRHQKDKQRKEGSYYTPRHIADLMVHATFATLRREGVAHTAKILDPAAGAGVFLITAFRQIVKERWQHDGKRPDTKALRQILYDQIRGFDINDSALRFAALGLYLISIELDAAPKPVEKLKFSRDLRQTVIFELGQSDEAADGSLGSLGDQVGPEHAGQYDLVIGNPPWSSATGLADWPSVIKRTAQIARERLNDRIAAPLPNEALDLPFVWRAMEWAKPDGQIAFALHGRLLFQRGEGMDKALAALCRAIDITGVVNGAEVRQSQVWPKVAAPFCLFFARNRCSAAGAAFRYVSPHLEGPLTASGGWRIDPTNTETIAIDELRQRPELLKILFRGTRLDLDIFERLSATQFSTFGEYWQGLHGGTVNQPNCAGKGFGNLFEGSRPNPLEDHLPGYSAEKMLDLPLLDHEAFRGVLLDTSSFRLFRDLGMPRLDQRRSLSLYTGPMLLVKKSPDARDGRIKTAVSLEDLTFNQSYYGYTAHRQESAADLVKYLCLIISSKIALWHALITSGGFGVERDPVEKFVIQEAPLLPFETLTAENRACATALFAELADAETPEVWQKVDEWVGSLFNLTPDDIQVISDTLAFALPFGKNRIAARAPVGALARAAFSERLEAELAPWGENFGRQFTITAVEAPPLSPWQFIAVAAGAGERKASADRPLMEAMRHMADTMSASELLYWDEQLDCLFVGRLNQARYWSVSQARLVARRIIWDNVDFLSGRRTT